MFLALALAPLVAAGQSKDRFPDVPANHWVFEDIQFLKNVGLTYGYPLGLIHGARPASRYEIAVATHVAYTNLLAKKNELLEKGRKPGFEPVGSVSKSDFAEASAIQPFTSDAPKAAEMITALVVQFKPELTELGVDTTEMKHDLNFALSQVKSYRILRPGTALSQFSDVQADHWAARQILELRKLGILQGYPSGRFAVE
jgi:hypothetical protein